MLLQVARKEYEFSLMQSGESARLKEENGPFIVHGELLNLAREVWNANTLKSVISPN